jgi:hypothetical protein
MAKVRGEGNWGIMKNLKSKTANNTFTTVQVYTRKLTATASLFGFSEMTCLHGIAVF